MNNCYRDINLAEITESDVGKSLKISGWIFHKRDHGGLLFLDIRDYYGILQTVCNEKHNDFETISSIRIESVVTIEGKIRSRSPETINESIPNGKIELEIEKFHVESRADVLPLPIASEDNYSEEIRLKYRFLDLRREKMKNNMNLRASVLNDIRQFMTENKFLEVQTPILTSSSPEGARDYLVPSRINKGKFYALPQAPQIFKQLLMVSGFDRYYQIAPCFRDEDSRADRSPGEFYQLDVEMAFVEQNEIFSIFEKLLLKIFKKYLKDKTIDEDFIQIPFRESIAKYGTDKPDLRNSIELSEVTDIFADSEFSIFKKSIEKGMIVKAIPAPGTGNHPRSFFDKKINYAITELQASGLGYINFNSEGEAKGPIAKFLTPDKINKLKEITKIKPGDAVFFSCDNSEKAHYIAGEVRKNLGTELGLIDENLFKFCWITDFPYFQYDETKRHVDFFHNPFSMPQGGLQSLKEKDPLDILAYQYDIVCNGVELSSGAIRNHKLDVLEEAFKIAGYKDGELASKFPSLYNAFKFGAPPHGGLAPGIDRIIMLLSGAKNIREVICFPLNQKGEDLMMGAPSTVSEKQLKELNITLTKKTN
ncbi:aspartate--tRNA ligase [Anaplasmataceae bacterium AB001_6]|nr:aspartate--tRNA ligase [Anaplasmataceae bacterium AB001_6]